MIDPLVEGCRKEMVRTEDVLRKELARLRTGRASTSLLEGLTVDYYGTRTPLNQLASLTAPEPRLLVVQPFDRSIITAIEKAVLQSDLGLTPQNDGKLIRIPIPELTEERRRELVKHVRKVGEEFRVSIRNHRRDAIEKLKGLEKEKKISEDDRRHCQERIEALTKEFVERVDKVLKGKEQEILAV
jgi:ribosome recycling factor